MNKFTSSLILSPPMSETKLRGEIIWGDENGGIAHFPQDIASINYRKKVISPRPLDAFKYVVSKAVERVWIIDAFFLIPDHGPDWDSRILSILDWFPLRLEASDIRILTKEHQQINDEMLDLFQMKADDINNFQARRPKKCMIQICTRLVQEFDLIHDRFAIVDDELWHFGATVGGFHTSINAASRGWNAAEVGAISFFEMVWEKCKEKK